jgi:multiple sugar transport system permease protein
MNSVQPKSVSRPHRASGMPHNRLWGLLLISPWLIGMILFKLVPILVSLGFSLTNYMLLEPKNIQFSGIENYLKIFKDPDVGHVLWQTVSLGLMIIPFQTFASVLLATILSYKKLLMKNTIRSLFFLPSIIPSAAAMYVTQGFINPSKGWLNQLILGPIGLASLNHLYSRNGGQTLFILTSLWAIGPGFLIILSALQHIPTEIHEAAQIDGANPITHFFRITLPLVSPAVFFSLIINLTAVFGGAILLDRGNSFSAAISSYDGYIHYVLFGMFQVGYASSLAWMFFIIMVIVVLTLFGTSKRWVHFPDGKA